MPCQTLQWTGLLSLLGQSKVKWSAAELSCSPQVGHLAGCCRHRNTEREEVPMKYKIAIHRTEEGISVSVPALPGCWSEGDTEDEALASIQDVICEYLAALEDRFEGAEVREIEV
jgi:predicted RNase H-like HicB family nuclease